jgi:hypothetical protein
VNASTNLEQQKTAKADSPESSLFPAQRISQSRGEATPLNERTTDVSLLF